MGEIIRQLETGTKIKGARNKDVGIYNPGVRGEITSDERLTKF
jgi:hypothetical protein